MLDRIIELQNILKTDKNNVQVRKEFALLLLEYNYTEEALKQLLYLAEKLNNDSAVFFNIGIAYEKIKDLNNAEIYYRKTIDIEPNNIDAYYNLGLIYIDKKLYDSAIDCFEKVLEFDNNDSNCYFSIGICYLKKGNLEGAKYYFKRTVDINNEDVYAHFYLGNIYKEQKDIENARNEFYKVLDISPDYSWAYFNLASMDYEAGFVEGAEDNLEKTLKYNPKDVEAYKIYTKILTKNRDTEKSLQIAQRAVNNCPEEGDLYYILAQVYKITNSKTEYVKNMTNALKHLNTLTVSPKAIKKEMDDYLT